MLRVKFRRELGALYTKVVSGASELQLNLVSEGLNQCGYRTGIRRAKRREWTMIVGKAGPASCSDRAVGVGVGVHRTSYFLQSKLFVDSGCLDYEPQM